VKPIPPLAPVAPVMEASWLGRWWRPLVRWMSEVPPNSLIWYAPKDCPEHEEEIDPERQDEDDQGRKGDDKRSSEP
jgi:hypothetical protein